MMRCYALVVAAVVLAAGRASAQDPIAGRWTTEYPTAIRNENGEETVVATRKATLRMATRYEFEVHGDALAGTSTLFAVDGSMDMPSRVFVASRVKP